MNLPGGRTYHQSRWACVFHGFFDLRLPSRPPESFHPTCPVCKRQAQRREGYECTGITSGPVPHCTKPRIEENPEMEIQLFDGKRTGRKRRGYYDRHTKEWKPARA